MSPPASSGTLAESRGAGELALRRLSLGLLVLYGVLTLVAVLFVPYSAWDALAFGEWSRLIEKTGKFHFSSLTPLMYQRPLFYVLQGWLWRWFGHSEALGRSLAVGFGILLFWVTARTAKAFAAPETARQAAYLSLLVLLTVQAAAEGISSGLSDVPVAALVGAAGACAFTLRPRPAAGVLAAAASALAVLAKPSALPALAGLAAAVALPGPGPARRRLLWGLGPIVAGAGVGLVYDFAEARRFGLSLPEFIGGALRGYYARRSAGARLGALLHFDWLGPNVRFLLAFAIFCAFVSLGRRRVALPRWSVAAMTGLSAAAALVAGWSALTAPGSWKGHALDLIPWIGTVFLAVALIGAARSGERFGIPRTDVVKLLVWAGPSLLLWLWLTAYDARLLSPVWVPLVLLIGEALMPAAAGTGKARWRSSAFAGLILLCLTNLPNVDGLGVARWKTVGTAIAHGRADGLRAELMPGFDRLRRVIDSRTGPDDLLFSSEGRLRYFFPGRVQQAYPAGCASLRGQQYFVLLTDARSAEYMREEMHASADPAAWAACSDPRLIEIARVDDYVVFRVVNGGEQARSAMPGATPADGRRN
jgi:hypothetical protein